MNNTKLPWFVFASFTTVLNFMLSTMRKLYFFLSKNLNNFASVLLHYLKFLIYWFFLYLLFFKRLKTQFMSQVVVENRVCTDWIAVMCVLDSATQTTRNTRNTFAKNKLKRNVRRVTKQR